MLIPDFEMQDLLVYTCEDGERVNVGRIDEVHVYGCGNLFSELYIGMEKLLFFGNKEGLPERNIDEIYFEDIVINVTKVGLEDAKRRLKVILGYNDYSKHPKKKEDFERVLHYLEQVKEV